jgi:hypothetical protein
VLAIRAGEEDRLAEHLRGRISGTRQHALIPVERARCVEIVGTGVDVHVDDKVVEPESGEGDRGSSAQVSSQKIEVSVEAGAVKVLV